MHNHARERSSRLNVSASPSCGTQTSHTLPTLRAPSASQPSNIPFFTAVVKRQRQHSDGWSKAMAVWPRFTTPLQVYENDEKTTMGSPICSSYADTTRGNVAGGCVANGGPRIQISLLAQEATVRALSLLRVSHDSLRCASPLCRSSSGVALQAVGPTNYCTAFIYSAAQLTLLLLPTDQIRGTKTTSGRSLAKGRNTCVPSTGHALLTITAGRSREWGWPTARVPSNQSTPQDRYFFLGNWLGGFSSAGGSNTVRLRGM